MSKTLARSPAHPLLRPVLIGLAGIAALTVSSYVSLPMYPVPVTLQTLSGAGTMTVSGESQTLEIGKLHLLPAGAPHALSATKDGPLTVLVHTIKRDGTAPHGHGH